MVVVVVEKTPEETFLISCPNNLSSWFINTAYPITPPVRLLIHDVSSLNSKNFLLDHNSLAESDIWLIILLIIETSFIFLTVVVVVVCPNPKKPPDLIESFSSYPNSLSTSFAKVAKGITLEDKLLTQALSNLNPKYFLELNNNLAAPAIWLITILTFRLSTSERFLTVWTIPIKPLTDAPTPFAQAVVG